MTIAKKALTAKDFAASIIYGNQDGKGWTLDKSGSLEGVVYGDDVKLKSNYNYEANATGAYATNKGDRTTADKGTYEGDLKISGITLTGDKAKNYTIAGEAAGDLTVNQAKLHVHTDDQTISVGQKPNYTGQLSGLVNGDTEEALGKLQYGAKPEYEQTVGTHSGVIQTVNGNSYGELLASYLKNYEFTYDWGNLTVQDAIPDTEFDYLFYDTPWDRPRNFRERRAELHFVDGGVHVG